MATGPKFLALILSLVVSCPWAGAATAASSSVISAKVSETHGSVFKRGFVDWEKDEWADPEPAKSGDSLSEGMQVGTGDKSWAEVTWPTVTTRAWANSVFAIAPNQRLVYLLGGQMLFNLDKHRKDKKDFFVWTKVLQARIRGTTVMVQCTHDVSRITVLEGVVEVMNRLDKSVVRVNPGVVYEVRTPGTNPLPPNISQAQPTATPTVNPAEDIVDTIDETANEQIPLKLTDKPTTKLPEITNNLKDAVFHDGHETIENASYDGGVKVKPKLLLADLHEMAAPGQAPIMVFSDAKAETRLYTADARELLLHPLVQGFNFRLPSLALVQNSLNNLPPLLAPPNPNITSNLPILTNPIVTSTDTLTGVVDMASSQITQPVVQTATILKVPMADQYLVGPMVGYALPLPPLAYTGYLPAGVLTGAAETMTGNVSSTNLRGQSPTNQMTTTNIPQMSNFIPSTTNLPQTTTFIPPTSNLPQTTTIIPPTNNLPQTTTFIPPTNNLPQTTTFIPPTSAPLPQVTNFVPPTMAPLPQITNFVPPTTSVPQMTNFVPPTATMPTMTMPVVNTFVPPTTTMPVVNSFIPPTTVNTTSTGSTGIFIPPPSGGTPSGNITLTAPNLIIPK